jgi:DNA polymerase III gamma/tau subunit
MQFKDIVGQKDIINRLTSVIDSGRVSHAQLILGS